MGKILPNSKIKKVAFVELRTAAWGAHAASLGLTGPEVAAVEGLAAEARGAYADQRAAFQAARAATLRFESAVAAMLVKTGEAIGKIKATAVGAGDAAAAGEIYALALLPAPRRPAPLGAPGTPSGLRVTLNPDGSLVLRWNCRNPAGAGGTIYEVRRKDFAPGQAVDGTGGFAHVGAVGVKAFHDDTVPAGTATVIYEITAVRSTRRGPGARFVVNLGVPAGGRAFAAVAVRAAA
jgi:hypothetical protein